uniref:Alpha-1,3-mannosyl-glycoprotein 2-beta-N-acetylglucosaminyltransferase n=1 Tax=Hemiscolopendra marginata TaxID=943146 RepID=A0A646QI39_9MYRI
MRNRQFLFIVCASLFSWGAITYYLFLQRPQGKIQVLTSVGEHLNRLEAALQQQYKSNEELLSKLRQLRARNHGNELPSQPGQELSVQGIGGSKVVIAVLVFACNRVTVKRNLDQLIKFRPSKELFPIIVTQDCAHEQTANAIREYGDQLFHIQQPDQSDVVLPPKEKKFKGYYKISRHYGWALNQTFHLLNYDTVIVVEDDLDIAPDFFEYFMATYPLLKSDPTLWCVSAWNDNGKESLVADEPELLYRTDFFPGLGWMLTRNLWQELQNKWPKAYWDDWMRQPEQRKDRACIRPEISRTKTFGKIGVSNGLFYEKHLKYIKLNDVKVPFTQRDVTYLKKDNYDVQFVKQVYDSPSVSWEQLKSGQVAHAGSVRVTYNSKETFKKLTKVFGLMDDLKSGVPRAGYRGVISFMFKERRVYLAPPPDWKGYDPTWS